MPLGLTGTRRKVPGNLVDSLSPLTIRPSYAVRALPWLLRFVEASRPGRIDAIANSLRALLKQTFDAWIPLTHWAGVPDIIRRDGYIVVYESERAYATHALALRIRHTRGVDFD